LTVRKLDFHWNLRQLMAAHDIWKTTELIPLLTERGVTLSTAQVYRLVTDKPERLSMRTLIALCDILDCAPSDLIDPYVVATSRSHQAVGDANVINVRPDFRPERARIVDDE
jgi:DNA-binding Xre family transcriptional regulator